MKTIVSTITPSAQIALDSLTTQDLHGKIVILVAPGSEWSFLCPPTADKEYFTFRTPTLELQSASYFTSSFPKVPEFQTILMHKNFYDGAGTVTSLSDFLSIWVKANGFSIHIFDSFKEFVIFHTKNNLKD